MVDVAKVNLFGQPMGVFRWDERYQGVQCEYDRRFAERGLEPSPLMMPVREGRVYSFPALNRDTFMGLPGMLADALPDTYGRALFDRWLALTGRTTSNPVETLCFLGKRCMGAMEFEPTIDTVFDPDQRFEIDSLVDVAREALADKAARRRPSPRFCAWGHRQADSGQKRSSPTTRRRAKSVPARSMRPRALTIT